jgi:putative peptidoglycan lipid II flippase
MKSKFTSSIAGAAVYISLALIIGKGLGFIREVVFAGYYGVGLDYDIYLVGAVIPVTINIIIYFIGQNFFIPAYNKLFLENEKKANEFTGSVLISFIIVSSLLSITLLFFSEILVKGYLNTDKLSIFNKALSIFRIFLITIPLSAGIAILSSFLHSKLEFKYPAISQLFLNLSIIFFVSIFTSQFSTYSIAIGYLTGTLIQFLYLLKKTQDHKGIQFSRSSFRVKNLKNYIPSSILYIILIESIGQLFMIIDRFYYSAVEIGGIASLNYAQSLYQYPIAIFVFALSSAIFPRISDAYNRNSMIELNNIIRASIRITLIIFIPISILFILYGYSIIQLIFERGRFTSQGTIMTSEILGVLSISLIFYSTYSIFNKIFYSGGFTKSLLIITITGIFVKFIMNIFLVKQLSQIGLALSTTLSYITFFLLAALFLKLRLKITIGDVFIRELVFNLSNALLSFFMTELIISFICIDNQMIFAVLIFSSSYILNMILVKHSTVATFKHTFSRLLPSFN